MKAVFETILGNIKKPDFELNMAIQAYIEGPYYFGEPDCPRSQMTVARWRIVHYRKLRRMAYPDKEETRDDAKVKLSSSDPDIRGAGQAQLDQYNADCLAVKARFPKE